MGIQSNYLEAAIADAIFGRTASVPAPPMLYFALFTALPDENGLNGQEVPANSSTGYQRRAVTNSEDEFPLVADFSTQDIKKGVKYNVSHTNKSIAFVPALSDWGDVVGFGIYDAATGGNLLISSPLDTPRTVVRNDTMRFVDRELKFTEFGQTPENIMFYHMQKMVLDSLFGRKIGYQTGGNTELFFSLFTTMPKPDETGYAVEVPCTLTGSDFKVSMASTTGIKPGMQVLTVGESPIVHFTAPNSVVAVDGNLVELAEPFLTPSLTSTTDPTTITVPLLFTCGNGNYASGIEVGGDCTIACRTEEGSDMLWVLDDSAVPVGAKVTGGSVINTGTTVLAKDVAPPAGSSAIGIRLSAPAKETAAAVPISFAGNPTGYARAPLANSPGNFPPYANGVKTNAAQVLWPSCTKEWTQVKGMGIHDAKVGGNLLFKIPFTSDRTFVVGEQPRLAANALSIYLD